jgi:penicillin-binding protein 1A
MTVFTWKGEKDTIMTPMDSIRYYKHFLQSGLMAMEPQTGNIKAWVGGIDYKYFQYDHVVKAQDKWALHLNLSFTLRRLNN